ncbi:DNA helicase [Clostridium sp. D2Q-11]|uniref:DNA helicase n=1 Tax=Anaeromonas frigoriresistens TaxID=2683708 RepID=A0A942Z7I2_9FIRM|nr:DEAD/DEAH box helicase [Anaeromonas frigoriresistens]MBS4536990.1 DNA helicase [Anaeromonas frigoriresistens]
MGNQIEEMTAYFRSAIASQSNQAINFKEDNYCIFSSEELIDGKIHESIYQVLLEANKDNKCTDNIKVIIVAKTIKTIFDSQEKINSDLEDLTGIYYIPAILKEDGTLSYATGKLPWIPRDYLQPIVEETLSIGHIEDFNNYMSKSIGLIHNIKTWGDYIDFSQKLYEFVTKSKFDDLHLKELEIEDQVYILKDNTINATTSILKLYDDLLKEYKGSKLYENFINLKYKDISPLVKNEINEMKRHSGQMGGEYPLSPSQRESINHFSLMEEGEILAINGPPGTGKTTLLQSIVGDLYVEKALEKEKPPLIVATSTNNQAVTNIIESFGKIEPIGYRNLEERWIEGVNSFATYFPSSLKEKMAQKKGYHFTNIKGEYFVSDIESDENIRKSKHKFMTNYNLYFNENISNLEDCENKIHNVLCEVNEIKKNILDIANKLEKYNTEHKNIRELSDSLRIKINDHKEEISNIYIRIKEWQNHFKNMPLLYKLLKFISPFKRKIHNMNRMFIEPNETFLNEEMSLIEIEEEYSYLIKNIKKQVHAITRIYDEIQSLIKDYDRNILDLKELNIDVIKEDVIYNLNLEEINKLLDTTLRYIQFWLAVHYYECRWLKGEDMLTEKQKGTNYPNVVERLYNRLSMITPCYVMTFYQLPRNFLCYEGGNKTNYLYNHIDLLIVDEAGQVSPEIGACSFSLAKKAVIVGDIHQIEPVWGVSRALDKSLAIENNVIENKEHYELLEELGLNASNSSIMKVASKACKYKKFNRRGLFLSEHRRCYNEIISYCNELVYEGNLKPMRGLGELDENYQLKNIPYFGYKQVDSDYSYKSGTSRFNKNEANEIANWLSINFQTIKKAYIHEEVRSLVGIITPFKAQAKYIEKELKKKIPHINEYISVGTVHTFQGAERRIVIMSSVYGKDDGCYFIDTNRSMLNVAVSRAKDSFLVFGDIRSFSNSKTTASGLLSSFIRNQSI